MTVFENLGDVRLSEILPWCLENGSDTLLFTNAPSIGPRGGIKYEQAVDHAARKLLAKNLLAHFEAKGWPGTRLTKHKAWVYVAKFDTQLARRMIDAQNNLFSWLKIKPFRLPEDVCVFHRERSLPTFVSVTHERDAWVIADTSPAGFKSSSFAPKDLYIGHGSYFCLV